MSYIINITGNSPQEGSSIVGIGQGILKKAPNFTIYQQYRDTIGPDRILMVSRNTSVFNDAWGWWRADSYIGSSPSIVLTDLSGNSRNMTQQAGTITTGTAANGQARMTGISTTYLTTSSTLESWPVTIFTVGRRTAGNLCGLFGHVGATGFNTLWYGHEASNSYRIYNANNTLNTDSNGGSDTCWMARIGYGSRVSAINNVIQANMPLASIARSSAVAASIGTQYRGLNFDWQECLVWNRLLSFAEIDEVNTYLNTRYGLTMPLWSSYTPSKTIWMGGQSNAAGRGDRGASNVNIPAEYLGPITNANIWHGSPPNNQTLGTAWETLDNTISKPGGTPYTGNHMLGDNAGQPTLYVGCESTLAKEYLDLKGGSIYLNKYAVGGTNLAYVNGTTQFWHPTQGTLAQSSTFRLFGQAMLNWWASIQGHQQASRMPNLVESIWFQGEQDAINSTYADAYQTNLNDFVSALRLELGFPLSKVYVCKIHTNAPETFKNTIRTAQSNWVAGANNAQLVDVDNYESRGGDPVHLSINGQISLGQYLATQLS